MQQQPLHGFTLRSDVLHQGKPFIASSSRFDAREVWRVAVERRQRKIALHRSPLLFPSAHALRENWALLHTRPHTFGSGSPWCILALQLQPTCTLSCPIQETGRFCRLNKHLRVDPATSFRPLLGSDAAQPVSVAAWRDKMGGRDELWRVAAAIEGALRRCCC